MRKKGAAFIMYDLSDFLRYSGLSALGLALAATGLPASAAVSQPQPTKVSTYLGTDAAAMQQQRRGERGERRGPRGDRGDARRGNREQRRGSTGQTRPPQGATSPEWDARLRAREAYRAQQRQESRREARRVPAGLKKGRFSRFE